MEEPVLLEVKEHIALLYLNRPRSINAMTREMVEGLTDILTQIQNNGEIRAAILTGRGEAFSAGGDLKSIQGLSAVEAKEYLARGHDCLRLLSSLTLPVIAAVNGYCLGAACSLALACDILLAAEDAKFSQIFRKVGVIPDMGGLWFLPRVVGMHRAKELIFTGRIFGAREALEMGMVNRVVTREELLAEALRLAQEISDGPAYVLGLAKKILNKTTNLNLEELLELEANAQVLCFQTEEYHEGVRAFLEDRKPDFYSLSRG